MPETYEKALFRYGITCADNLLLLGKISQKDYDKLYSYIGKEDKIQRDFLERIFSAAVQRIGSEKTPEAVEDYFLNRHNQIIDRREGNYSKIPDELCETCKVKDCVVNEVFKKKGKNIYVISDSGKNNFAFGDYLSEDIKKGDLVRIHNNYIIKKLN